LAGSLQVNHLIDTAGAKLMITMFFLGVICAFSLSSVVGTLCVATLFWNDDRLLEINEIDMMTLASEKGQAT
jgi:hypothetical protein